MLAATYLFGLAKNHAFQDGNKRIAAAATVMFLSMNDLELSMTADELADVTLAVADGSLDKDLLAEVLRNHIKPAIADEG